MDDTVHSVSAMGGGLAFSYISEKAGEMLPGAAGKYAPVGFALLLTGAMGLTARRSMALRAFFLGGIGSLATDQARKLGYQAPVTAMEGMGRVSSAQRIASILGTGPGRSQMDHMGYLAPGSPAIRQTASSMGYLAPGGPFVNQTEISSADVY